MDTWHPTWWNDAHTSTWDRVKEALRRDWEQTKYDFGAKSGHYLHQDAAATVAQATGKQALPKEDQPNPPKVIGEWSDAESAMGYGYVARQRAGEGSAWDEHIEKELQKGWESGPNKPKHSWEAAAPLVRRGWETTLKP